MDGIDEHQRELERENHSLCCVIVVFMSFNYIFKTYFILICLFSPLGISMLN